MAKKSPRAATDITAITHDDATRKNIPTAELQSVIRNKLIVVAAAKHATSGGMAERLIAVVLKTI